MVGIGKRIAGGDLLETDGGRYVALARILGQRIALLRQAIEGSR